MSTDVLARVRPGRLAAAVVAVFALSAAVGFAAAAQGAAPAPLVTGPYPAGLRAAADALEAATGAGGTGYQFEVEQRQAEDALPGGPEIALYDPSDKAKVTGHTAHFYVNSTVVRGRVAPGALWMEMRVGPGEGVAADFDKAPPMWAVIWRDQTAWRNEGQGWFRADTSPGVGMDPVTAARLPGMLRNLSNVTDIGPATLQGGAKARHYAGLADIADFPGVVASDGAPFTESPVRVDVWVDQLGRVVRIEATARNLNEAEYNLHVDTVITFSYTAAGPVPDPAPLAPADMLPNP